jgi:flagellar M-ring protein FliF
MGELKSLWGRQSPGGRLGLVAGIVFIVLLAAGGGYWAMARSWQPLFTDLGEQDAATLVAELDRLKLPYRLDANGGRILVPEELVHKTRLTLVGRNLPLHGAVGFEIFNNTDFGMTEFNQRVNYQRALQGELTRTIMSIEEVQAARVHLVLPESTLFKREQNKPKASVALTLKAGRHLDRDQVQGVQRLVAAAVPGIEPGDVTVLDQKGATLSRRVDGQGEAAAWQLQTKHEIEEHLARKAGAVLDRAYGAGQGLVSVDVVLNFDQVKTTTEEVLGTKAGRDAAPAGVVVRERQTVREASPPPRDGADQRVEQAAVTQSDVEYQAGRRVEQIVASPGSVRRVNVAVVLPRAVAPERIERVRQLVAAAVGLDARRGDSMAIHALDQVSDGTPTLTPVVPDPNAPLPPPAAGPAAAGATPTASDRTVHVLLALVLAAVALLGGLLWGRRARPEAPAGPRTPLVGHEREALLQNVQRWLLPAEASRREGRQA